MLVCGQAHHADIITLTHITDVKAVVQEGFAMRISIGSDERTHLTNCVVEDVRQRGHEVSLFGSLADQYEVWPTVAERVAERVAYGDADEGVLLCWTGTGVSIAANKIPGVRAALCDDPETARGARLWNNANVLCLSIRRAAEEIAKEILEAWFITKYSPNKEDDLCLSQLAAIEGKHPVN
jgi:ribose 5-phosphate isomerase B